MRFKLQCRSLGLAVLLVCLAGVESFHAAAQQGAITSVYTETTGNRCKTISVDRETDSAVWRCPGIAGYRLLVENGDARMSITVVAPNGKKSALNYWGVITSGFSTIGDKAEWRVRKTGGRTVPVALIVRVNANENSEAPERMTSYLAVAKITPQKTCVTDKIASSQSANEEARRAADNAASKRCLEESLP